MTPALRSHKPARRVVTRRRRHERQILVFGLLSIVLATISFAAWSIYQGEVEGPFSAPIYTPPAEFESDIRLVCPPAETYPVDASEVPVRVFNGGGVRGLAGSVASTLEGRNFHIMSVGNATRSYDQAVRIAFGAEGLVRAYTLATHFERVELVYDTRVNGVIDLTLGAEFDREQIRPLLSPELQQDVVLTSYAQCLPIGLVQPEPAPRNIPDDPLAPDASPRPESEDDVDPGFDPDMPLD